MKSHNNADNGNNRPEDERDMTANIDSVATDRKNGNESTTTTDTNSDSLIAQSSDTPPDTINSSPNTRSCSPSRTIGLHTNVSNVNGMIKKSTLKATLSLDPSALCRGTIPYEKITTRTQRSSTPGSMELRKVTWPPPYIRRPAKFPPVHDRGPWSKVLNTKMQFVPTNELEHLQSRTFLWKGRDNNNQEVERLINLQ